MRNNNRRAAFLNGIQDGIPIALGYFAVSFSLGIAARSVGLSPMQGFLASALCNASAGEYALFTLIGAKAALWEIVLVTLIANARYFLMSCALSQRFSPETPFFHRLLIGNYITDEFFGISVAREGWLKPAYYYGAVAVAAPCWAVGTALGIRLGLLLSPRIVSALSVALYGMFLAVIIPPAKRDRAVACCVAVGFLCSWAFGAIPALAAISAGTRTILLTVGLSAAAALLLPVREEASHAE